MAGKVLWSLRVTWGLQGCLEALGATVDACSTAVCCPAQELRVAGTVPGALGSIW